MKKIAAALLLCSSLYSLEPTERFEPWFTGPIFATTGHTMVQGYLNLQPYFFYLVYSGEYNKNWHFEKFPKFYTANIQLPWKIGITDWLEFAMNPQASYNRTEGKSAYVFNDLFTRLGFQLYRNDDIHAYLKFSVGEFFPTGRYERLNPDKLTTDLGGMGSFGTNFGLAFVHTVHIKGFHYFSYRINGITVVWAPTTVHGFNAYGGGFGTKGTVHPGLQYSGVFGAEYSLSRNWALACDLLGAYQNKSTFSGKPGKNPDGTVASVGFPSSTLFTVAPALEYNFSSSLGLIGGGWFSFAGRNAAQFNSFVLALNWHGPVTKGAKEHKAGIYIPSGTGGK